MGLFGKLFGGGNGGEAQATAPDAGPFEASMNFDLGNVRPFLERLRDRRGIAIDVETMARFAEETAVEDEREMTTRAAFERRDIALRYSVFMDDFDAPDLYFFADDRPLIDTINAEYVDFCEELGI